MSDAVDSFYSKQLLRKSSTNPMRERMQTFLDENPPANSLKQLRERASSGDELADVVIENREERF